MTSYQPAGYHAVTPWVISRDTARMIEFAQEAFGAAELGRVPDPAGGIAHAEVRIGDSVVMMFDARDGWPDTPAFLRLYVPDCDVAHQRALRAGATSVTAPTSLYFGDQVCRVRDPLGNVWWLQTHVTDVDPADLAAGPRDQAEAEALRYVQESLTVAMRTRPDTVRSIPEWRSRGDGKFTYADCIRGAELAIEIVADANRRWGQERSLPDLLTSLLYQAISICANKLAQVVFRCRGTYS